LAAREPGPDELVGIGPVGLRAGRADRGAAVSAGDVDRLVRQVVGIQVPEDLAGRSVDVADGAAQPDWADAPSPGLGGTEPLLVVITGSALKQFRVEGAGARSRPRTVIDQDWGRHQAGGAHGQPLAWCCRSRGGWKKRGNEGAPRPREAREAPRFPALLVSIRVSRTA